jgi:hypothetical protein
MSNCDCDYSSLPIISRCNFCGSSSTNNVAIVQKRIWNQVREPASLYTMAFAALANTQRIRATNPINWNQSSDQQVASIQTAYHPTRGNSTKRTLTSIKPGTAAPAGRGVDIKHNSYDRYLNRLKAGNIRTQSTATQAPKPKYGNKVKTYGMISNSDNCCPTTTVQ